MADFERNKHWTVVNKNKWEQKEYFQGDDLDDTLKILGYPPTPDLLIGGKSDFAAIFEHPESGKFLCFMQIEHFSKVMFAENLPGMFHLMEMMNALILGTLRMKKLADEVQDE